MNGNLSHSSNNAASQHTAATVHTAQGVTMNGKHKLTLIKKNVQRVNHTQLIREATTGRVIAMLPRVWAVATETVATETVATETAAADPAAGHGPQTAQPLPKPAPQLAFYRKYTEAMLRRYLRLSMSGGRTPTLLGRELFRGNVTSYRMVGFDDQLIFCMDIERCVAKLSLLERDLIKRIAIQEYSQGQAAAMLGISLRYCTIRYNATLDKLTAIFLETRLLEPLKSCQGGKTPSNELSPSFEKK